jgi:iron-sulfur cluster assembly accessory protein
MAEEMQTQPPDSTPGPTAEPVLGLTESAAEMARAAMQREGRLNAALRVAVVGGGCSGFQYNLGFDDTTRPDDVVLEQHGVRMLVDSTSLQYLQGTVIDYVHGLHGAGFKFINPNANRTCGCGSSFSA